MTLKMPYTGGMVDVGQAAWFDAAGVAMTDSATIQEFNHLEGGDVLLLPIRTVEAPCSAEAGRAFGPGQDTVPESDVVPLAEENGLPTTWRLERVGGPAARNGVGVAFDVPTGSVGPVALAIYDVAGRRVAMLHEGVLAPGSYYRDWNGRNSRGSAVASGVYFAQLRAQGSRVVAKIVLTR